MPLKLSVPVAAFQLPLMPVTAAQLSTSCAATWPALMTTLAPLSWVLSASESVSAGSTATGAAFST